ncbi:MAG: SDR family oxidoreductase [Dehalococcoidia bacterium]
MQAVVGDRALEKQAASTNTLSWFETEVLVTEENLKGLEQMQALTPGRVVGELEDIGHMIAFLVSDEAKFITGQNYSVNGGAWMG